MVHIIPLFVGERRLDTGNAVQYPDSSPVGEAMQQFGDRWQAAAERYEQRKAQQQAFDTEIAARRLNGELAKAEADAVANSPADGAGLHDTMYGQVDPYTGQVVKTGLFDTLFGNFLKQVPPELRAGLAARKEALRAVGGRRMAAQQNQRRKQYEQDQAAEIHTAVLSNIAQSDPNDTAAFDASRQAGLDLIAKMDLDPRAKALAEADWLARTAKERMQALIAQDPRRAAEMLSAGLVASDGMGETVRSQLGAAGRDEQAAAKGDWRRNKTPDEVIAQAFSDLPEEEQRAIRRQADAANLALKVKIGAAISRAEAEAPDHIARTGAYSGNIPGEDAYKIVYGPDEGPKRRQDLEWQVNVGKKIFDMGTMSNQAIKAAIVDVETGSNSLPDRKSDEATAVAGKLVLERRRVDSGDYISDTSQEISAGWKAVFGNGPSDPEAYDQDIYDRTIELSVAAQKTLGVDDENLQPVPLSILLKLAEDRDSGSMDLMDNYARVSELFRHTKGAVAQAALVRELDQAGLGGILPGGKPGLFPSEVFRADAKAIGKETANAGILAGKLIKGGGYVVSLGSTERPDFGHGYYEPANSTEKVMMRLHGDALSWGLGEGVAKGIGRGIDWFASAPRQAERSAGVSAAAKVRNSEGAAGEIRALNGTESPADGIPAKRQSDETSDALDSISGQAAESGAVVGQSSTSQDIHVYHMRKWDASQREKAALKAQRLTDRDTSVNHHAVRDSNPARRRYTEAGNEVAPDEDVDHIQDLQLNGSEDLSNLDALDRSVNRSFGIQIKHQIKNLPHGTKINKVTIGDR